MSQRVRTILFVDHSEADVQVCELAASRSNVRYDIRYVADAQNAMQWLMGTGIYQRRNIFPLPDAVVTDIRLQGEDGLELLNWIRRRPELRELPVIVHTHSQTIGDAVLSHVKGVTQYIIKDGECRRLMQCLEFLFANDAKR